MGYMAGVLRCIAVHGGSDGVHGGSIAVHSGSDGVHGESIAVPCGSDG